MMAVAFLVVVYNEIWESYKKPPDTRSWDFKTVAVCDNNTTTQKTQHILGFLVTPLSPMTKAIPNWLSLIRGLWVTQIVFRDMLKCNNVGSCLPYPIRPVC